MERTLAFTTLLLASSLAQAAHPLRTARKALPVSASAREAQPHALSRTIYLDHDGATLYPGDNDAALGRSTIVDSPVAITPWDVDDEMWHETVACIRDLYARFDVTVTDQDPGASTPHIRAIFGGHPNDVGLPDYVAGVSPFRTDCGIIENSIVFTFTDVLDDDPQLVCEVMAQEIAHSYGLDHEMLDADPMTYLDYDGNREFQDQEAACGEDEERPCGIDGSVCWQRQSSVQLLASRLGWRDAQDAPPGSPTTTAEPEVGGCSTSGSAGPLGLPIGMLVVLHRMLRSRHGATRTRSR